MSKDLKTLLERRNKALMEMDMGYFREQMPYTTDEVRILAAHKTRYNCTSLPAEFRHASGAWLRERGYNAGFDQPLLPEGELPE